MARPKSSEVSQAPETTPEVSQAPEFVYVFDNATKQVIKINAAKEPDFKKKYFHRSGVPFTD